MKTIIILFLLLTTTLSAQDTLIIPKGTTNLANIQAPATPTSLTLESLNIRGRSAPGVLNIYDNFGKVVPIFSIGGDLAVKMYSDPARAISGSILFQNSSGEDVFRFRQDGSIRFTKIIPHAINQSKFYYVPILDEVGNMVYVRVNGAVVGYLYR